NLMKQAANFQKWRLPMALPGITVSTSPTHYYPIQAGQLQRLKGETREVFGEVMHAESSWSLLRIESEGRRPWRRPFAWVLLLGRSLARLQGLAALRGVDAAVFVEVAGGEVGVGLDHEFAETDEAVLVGVEQLKIARLALHLPVGRQHAVAGRRCAREQLLLAELAVAVDVEPLEARLLARLPFGAVDHAVLVGVVAHQPARQGARGTRSGLVGRRRLVIRCGLGGAGEQQQDGGRQGDELQHGSISFGLYREAKTLAPFPLPGRVSADIVAGATQMRPCCGFVLGLSTWCLITTFSSSAQVRAACGPRGSRPATARAWAFLRITGSAAPA